MSKHNKYILGIDMGIASIGYSAILCDNEINPIKILDSGVRIFAIPGGAGDRRSARLSRKHTKNKRQRLASLRKLLQENNLLPLNEKDLDELADKNPYLLRAKGVSAPYENIHDLGRALMHIVKFRGAGFLSQMEENPDKDLGKDSEKDKQKTADSYRYLENLLKNENMSLSEYFLKRLDDNKPVRRRVHSVAIKKIEYAVPRFLVKEEFHRIWNMQKLSHTFLNCEELKDKIYKAIFSDSPIAPYASGNCTLKPDEKRLPRMHRLAEKRRIYEQINHIRYVSDKGDFPLPKELRDKLVFLAFEKGEDLNKTKIKKISAEVTGEKIVAINLVDDDTKIRGFCQIAAFKDIPTWKNFSEDEQDEIINFIADPAIKPNQPDSPLYPNEEFLEIICQRLKLEGKEAEEKVTLAIYKLAKDRSRLGISATKAILEKLEEGYYETIKDRDEVNEIKVWRPHSHRSAADACGFVAEEEAMRSVAGSFDKLPYYGEVLKHDTLPVHPWHKKRAAAVEAEHGRIPNPVVHVALNQLRLIVNEIVDRYGKPQKIKVELARELGLSKENRDKRIAEMKKNEKANDIIKNELKELKLSPTRNNIIKYKLWKEQGGNSLFSCKNIPASDIQACEIEHLVPRSLGGTNTYMNLCLILPNENFAKANSFPQEFIQKKSPEKWLAIAKHIEDKKYPKAKAWRFYSDAKEKFSLEGDDEQTDHRLIDSSYMAKLARRYLTALCSDVSAVKGGTTSYLRHLWGLDGLEYEIFNLDIHKDLFDPESGEIKIDEQTGYPEKNPLWVPKPRIDHRHHALDAIVIACTTRQMVKNIVLAEKRNQKIKDFIVPFGENASDFRYQVKKELENIIVSPKPEHGKKGELHDATKYRIIAKKSSKKKNNNDAKDNFYLIRYRKSLDTLKSKKNVRSIMFNQNTISLESDEAQNAYKECLHIIASIEDHYDAAKEQILINMEETRQAYGKTPELSPTVNESHIVSLAINMAQKKCLIMSTYPCLTHKRLYAINSDLKYGYEARNNLCMDFFEDRQGKIGWELIKFIEANTPNFKPEWENKGDKKIWTLYKDDVVEVFVSEQYKKDKNILGASGKRYFTVQKMSDDIMQLNLLNDARPLDGKIVSIRAGLESEEEYKLWHTGGMGLKTFLTLKPRKIILSPAGKIKRKLKRIQNDEEKDQ